MKKKKKKSINKNTYQKQLNRIVNKLGRKSYIIVFIALIGYYGWDYWDTRFPSTTTTVSEEGIQLVACVGGDTAKFLIDGNEEKVRFLAVDTPETKHPQKGVEPYGQEASDYTCNRLTTAETIVLEYEESNQSDKYGRVLAWVWVDGNLLQRELVSGGYAEVKYIYGDYKYTDELYGLEDNAKQNKLRIWSDE